MTEKDDVFHQVFTYGNKKLEVWLDKRGEAGTKVENIPDLSAQAGSTTEVYQQAYSFMQRYALAHGAFTYYFKTNNEKMIEWATDATKGREVFHWDAILPTDGVYKFLAIKQFPDKASRKRR